MSEHCWHTTVSRTFAAFPLRTVSIEEVCCWCGESCVTEEYYAPDPRHGRHCAVTVLTDRVVVATPASAECSRAPQPVAPTDSGWFAAWIAGLLFTRRRFFR